MIENLNAISFKLFGEIIHPGFHEACLKLNCPIYTCFEKEVKSGRFDSVFNRLDTPAALDVVDGIALLCVSLPDQEKQVRVFLLDKAVLLRPGVLFLVIPLYGTCVYKTAYNQKAVLAHETLSDKLEIPSLYPKFEIKKVHTLFYQEKEHGFIFKGEKHDFWELTYVDRGNLYSIVDGKGYKLQQGNVLFYGPGQHHIQWSEPGASACFVTITFEMDFEDSAFLTDTKFTAGATIKELLEKIIGETEHGSYYSDDLIICYLKEFIIHLVRSEKLQHTIYQQDTQIKQKIENAIVARSIEYIHKNLNKKITVGEIARIAAISPSYLSAIFKKHMNSTIVDYMNHLRLEKSKELIRTSEYNFTQISELLGYASVHYFSSQFKQKYGISPTEYARTIKG